MKRSKLMLGAGVFACAVAILACNRAGPPYGCGRERCSFPIRLPALLLIVLLAAASVMSDAPEPVEPSAEIAFTAESALAAVTTTITAESNVPPDPAPTIQGSHRCAKGITCR